MQISQSTIFWDWNGTLLNDTEICVQVMNNMLHKRGKELIDIAYYKQVFGFPVIEYYKVLGFDFDQESFEDLSIEFIAGYNEKVGSAQLHVFSKEVLSRFKKEGKKQVVISAMEHNMLVRLLAEYELDSYFDDVKGLDNIYANSKSHLAKNYLQANKISEDDVLFIGDTLHDIEVAEEVGVEIVLVANGHHSAERLSQKGHLVVEDLQSILNFN